MIGKVVVEMKPAWTNARMALASALEYLGRDEEALEQVRRSVEYEPRDYKLWLRLVDLPRQFRMKSFDIAVRIPCARVSPIAMEQLNKTDTPFSQSASSQTFFTKRLRG